MNKRNHTVRLLLITMLIAVFALAGCAKNDATSLTVEAPLKTGIIGAMAEEVDLLKHLVKNAKATSIAGMEFYEGILDDKNVVIVKCGIGKVNAGTCAQLLINVFGVKRIINTGVAGSLDAKIDIGDIVVSTDAVQHDFDLTPLGYAPGELDGIGSPSLPADAHMRESAVKAVRHSSPEIHVFEGRVCTGDQFISSKEQKKAIVAKFGGLCCEMEGGAIAQICCQNKIPFVIIRAISDKADGFAEMSYAEFMQTAARRCAAITRHMISQY
ncbi:MAG: 5'-methylthioadenosine/adenosylhomocysteine nucleosidase [Mailhella sp.]|nr:5'-methylthioadenosine/adenosylhomocysteine nucleosidase [Mailhella sp.]